MNRRQYLVGIGTVSAGFTFLAGCSGDGSTGTENGDSGETDENERRGGRTDETNADDGFDTGTQTEQTGGFTAEDGEAIETGAPPPAESQTPFENTNTVPAEDGLETGQAPNGTASDE